MIKEVGFKTKWLNRDGEPLLILQREFEIDADSDEEYEKECEELRIKMEKEGYLPIEENPHNNYSSITDIPAAKHSSSYEENWEKESRRVGKC